MFENTKSSCVRYIEDSLLNSKPITAPKASAVKRTADVIKYVEETPGAISIIGNNWLNDKRDSSNLTFYKNIAVMSVSKMVCYEDLLNSSHLLRISSSFSSRNFFQFKEI